MMGKREEEGREDGQDCLFGSGWWCKVRQGKVHTQPNQTIRFFCAVLLPLPLSLQLPQRAAFWREKGEGEP